MAAAVGDVVQAISPGDSPYSDGQKLAFVFQWAALEHDTLAASQRFSTESVEISLLPCTTLGEQFHALPFAREGAAAEVLRVKKALVLGMTQQLLNRLD